MDTWPQIEGPAVREHDRRPRSGRDANLEIEAFTLTGPSHAGSTVRRAQRGAGVGQPAARSWFHLQPLVRGRARCEPGHPAVQEVDDRPEGVVVERGHLARIDGPVR